MTSNTLLVLKYMRPVLKRAEYMHKDCCKNSCDPDSHYAECIKEKFEMEQLKSAIKAL